MTEAADPDPLMTVPSAVRYLERHGITVHENTVRHWYRSGRIAIIRKDTPSGRSAVFIPLSTLARIANCPFCAGR